MKYFLLIYALTVVATISILGFRGETSRKPPIEIFPDMDRQLKFLEQSENSLFSDGQSDRLPPQHSVPRGNALGIRSVFSTKASDRNPGSIEFRTGLGSSGTGHVGFPPEVTPSLELMRLGKERYDIYCSRCHGAFGNGKGPLSKFGLQPRNLTDPSELNYLVTPIVRDAKGENGSVLKVQHGFEGYVAHVIAEGFNTMLG
ncbi:MAG: cytochrome c, partial [Opitutales bacterium]